MPPPSTAVAFLFIFFFNDTATTEIYTLSLHDALPIAPHDHLERRGRRLRGLAHARKIDDARIHERRGDHENHEQHQHHVHIGDDVDLVHQAARAHGLQAPFASCALASLACACRCRMLENSSMKLSKRTASRSTLWEKRL